MPFVNGGGGGGVPVGGLAQTSATPADPTGTATTASFVMMGLSVSITPVSTGKVCITIDGDTANTSGSGGQNWQMATGTGVAPVNGAAASGTVRGARLNTSETVATVNFPFSMTRIVTGLAVNTAVWIDVQLQAVTAGTASLKNLTVTARELF